MTELFERIWIGVRLFASQLSLNKCFSSLASATYLECHDQYATIEVNLGAMCTPLT